MSVNQLSSLKNICGGDYSDVTATGGQFNVVPPTYDLTVQTLVVSQLTTGDYGIDQCFTSTASRQGKLTSNPGSVHIASEINLTSSSTCEGVITNGQVVLTLPAGFSFDKTGASPTAHIFVGTGNFDLHNPTNSSSWSEVTSLPEVTQTVSGQTDTINLGIPIPSSSTIYVRAHATYTGPGVASNDQQFTFTSSASGMVNGTPLISASPMSTIVANPTTYTCTDGHPPAP